MNITTTNNNLGFKAEIHPYPHTISNKKVFEKFREKTADYPNWILKQDSISFAKEDGFYLINPKNQVVKFSTAAYTSKSKTSLDDCVDTLVKIFNSMVKSLKNPKKIH